MNCQLPATGTTAGTTLVVAAIIVIAGLVALLVTRRHGARAVVPVVLILAAALGFAPAPPADAASDCPTTTAPAVTASTAPPTAPSTTVVESPSSSSVTSTIAPTTSTTIDPGIASFCGALVPTDGGGITIDVSIELTGGAGSFTASAPSTGACDGEDQTSGPVVDSDFFNPDEYCGELTAIQAATAGAWTPPIDETWYACIDIEEPSTTSPPTTAPPTTSPIITFCGTQTPNGSSEMLDVFITMQGGEGMASLREPADPPGDCSGPEFGTIVVVDSDFFEPVQYCLDNAPSGYVATNGATSGAWTPQPPPATWYGCAPPPGP